MHHAQIKAHVRSYLHQLVSFHRVWVCHLKRAEGRAWHLTDIRCRDCDKVFFNRPLASSRFRAVDTNTRPLAIVTFRALNSKYAQAYCLKYGLHYMVEVET